jgi:hypothetical protein
MNTLKLTDEQLNIVQSALDFYSRVGTGQFGVIKDHPTFEKNLYKKCTPQKEIEVGDRTPQGEVLEIKDGYAIIDGSVKDGKWSEEKGKVKIEDVVLSTDYNRYHKIRDNVDLMLVQPRNFLLDEPLMDKNASWGIHNENVDKTCRIAFDIIQVIRHERWKKDSNKNNYTVDSSIHFSHREDNSSDKIVCKLEK